MGVLVGVHDELDATFHAVLLALIAKRVKNVSNYCVDVVTNVDDCLDHTVVHICIFNVDRRCSLVEHSLIAALHEDSVDHSLDEADVVIDGWLGFGVLPLIHSELCLSLLEHLLLLAGYALALDFFLLPYLSLVLRLDVATALAAPALALLRAELVSPAMSAVALNDDDGRVLDSYDLDTSFLPASLATNCVHNLDAVVAEAVLTIHEIPEFDIAAMAGLLLLLLLLSSGARRGL